MARNNYYKNFRKKQKEGKKTKKGYAVKQKEQMLFNELSQKLDVFLKDTDEVVIEIPFEVLEEFMSIIDGPLASLYSYNQESATIFSFRAKEIVI